MSLPSVRNTIYSALSELASNSLAKGPLQTSHTGNLAVVPIDSMIQSQGKLQLTLNLRRTSSEGNEYFGARLILHSILYFAIGIPFLKYLHKMDYQSAGS